jgi:hypothetical protein
LTNLIGDKDLKVNYGLLSPGHDATTAAGTSATIASAGLGALGGGATAFFGGGLVDVLLQQGGFARGVAGLTASGRDVGIAQPDFLVTAHELFGETFKYTRGKTHLQHLQYFIDDNRNVIRIENEIRQFHGLPIRSGKDHGLSPATTVEVR